MRIRMFLAGVLAWMPLVASGLEVGDVVPDFEFHGAGGVIHHKTPGPGARGAVIAWFPKAFTPG